MKLEFSEEQPHSAQFFNLFETTGWNKKLKFTENDLDMAIRNSWYMISVYHKEELIGFGRVISDGVYQTFIGDMIIKPEYQRQGIGTEIMNKLISKCKEKEIKWIQLTSAAGKSAFYERFGFKERPENAPGMQLYL